MSEGGVYVARSKSRCIIVQLSLLSHGLRMDIAVYLLYMFTRIPPRKYRVIIVSYLLSDYRIQEIIYLV